MRTQKFSILITSLLVLLFLAPAMAAPRGVPITVVEDVEVGNQAGSMWIDEDQLVWGLEGALSQRAEFDLQSDAPTQIAVYVPLAWAGTRKEFSGSGFGVDAFNSVVSRDAGGVREVVVVLLKLQARVTTISGQRRTYTVVDGGGAAFQTESNSDWEADLNIPLDQGEGFRFFRDDLNVRIGGGGGHRIDEQAAEELAQALAVEKTVAALAVKLALHADEIASLAGSSATVGGSTQVVQGAPEADWFSTLAPLDRGSEGRANAERHLAAGREAPVYYGGRKIAKVVRYDQESGKYEMLVDPTWVSPETEIDIYIPPPR